MSTATDVFKETDTQKETFAQTERECSYLTSSATGRPSKNGGGGGETVGSVSIYLSLPRCNHPKLFVTYALRKNACKPNNRGAGIAC